MSISPLDFILLQLGTPGYYITFLGFLLCCLQLPIVFTELVLKYYLTEPPHRCKIPASMLAQWKHLRLHKNEWYPLVPVPAVVAVVDPGQQRSQKYPHLGMNLDQLLMLNHNHNHNNNHTSTSQMFDQCNIYIDPVHHWKGKQPCPNGWEYWSPKQQQQNLVTEFSLVCDNRYLAQPLLTMVIGVSGFAGAILFGMMADKLGRCRTLNVTIYLFVASALSVYFAADFWQFALFYNLQTFFINGLQISAYVILMEIHPTPYQLRATVCWFTFRTLVTILVTALVHTIHDWRYQQLSIAVPSFAFITYLFVMPRSPLWQAIVQRDQRAAVKTLRHFGKFSHRPPISVNQLELHIRNLFTSTLNFATQIYEPISGSTNSVSRAQIPRAQLDRLPRFWKPGPRLRWYMLCSWYMHFVLTIVDSELFLEHSLKLNQNPLWDSIYNCLIDLSFIIISYHFAMWFGSRTIQSLLFTITGVLIIVALVLKQYLLDRSSADHHHQHSSFDFRLLLLPPSLLVVARSISRSVLIFVTFHTVKSIPTNLRATGLGCCIFWSQLAKLSVQHLMVLSAYLPYNLVPILFGSLTLFSGLISWMFPAWLERKPLPNTLQDLEPELRNRKRSGYNPAKSKSKSNSTSTTSTSSSSQKRYPSYRDLRSGKNRSASAAQDIYQITPNGDIVPTNSSVRSIRVHTDRGKNGRQGQEILILTTGDQQSSLTEKTSLSSVGVGNNNGMIHDQSFESSGNHSFGQDLMINPARHQKSPPPPPPATTTYIPYNQFDPFDSLEFMVVNQSDYTDRSIRDSSINHHHHHRSFINGDLIESGSIHV